MAHKRFLVRTLIIFLTLVALGTLFNVLVDPYGLFEIVRVRGLNEIKPMAGSRVRVTKPYQLVRAGPKTLVAGNSRPELGIDPASECWAPDARPVFNAGLPGVGVYYQARMIQAAIEGGTVKRLFWGLDFLDFIGNGQANVEPWPFGGGMVGERLPTTAAGHETPDYAWQAFLDMRDAALSLDALLDSVVTVLRQGRVNSATRRADGFNPGRDYIEIVNTEGQGVLFRQKNDEVIERLSKNGLALYPPGVSWSREFESVRFILQLAEESGVETTLFINPYHADYLTAIDLTDNWRLFEEWKRRLTRLASTSEKATIWDFNAFDQYSSTPPPDDSTRGTALDWYWEPAHYRTELGNLMIARMSHTSCKGADGGFGARIETNSIESHLLKLRNQKGVYLKRFAERVSILEAQASAYSSEVFSP